jgi:hypothetical protein
MAMIFGATLQFESGYDAHASLTRLVDATPSQSTFSFRITGVSRTASEN